MTVNTAITRIRYVFEENEGAQIFLSDGERNRLTEILEKLYSEGYQDGQSDFESKNW